MAVIKTSKGYKNTKTGKYYSSQSRALAGAKQTREEQITNIKSTADKIQSAFNKVKGKMTQEERTRASQGIQLATSGIKQANSSSSREGVYNGVDYKSNNQHYSGLPKTTIPTVASDLSTPFNPYTTSQTTPGMGDITAPTAGIDGMSAYIESEKQRKLLAEQTRQAEVKTGFQGLMESLTSPKDARQNAWDETGMDVGDYFSKQEKSIKEVESLTKSYNAIVAAKDQQIAQTNDKMGSMNFINNQVAQIERNAAPQLQRISADINAKAAVMEAEQGNFAEAQKYVNQAVQDATAENKFQFDMFTTAYEINKDSFDRLDTIYSDAYKEQMTLAQMAYEEQLAEKQTIGKLLLEYPNAGIDIYNDTYEEALSKAGIRAGVIENAKNAAKGTYSEQDLNRAYQVLSGEAALSDFTTAEQAKVRDAIWSIDTPDETFTTSLQNERNQSLLPSVVSEEWDNYRLSVAGPGTGITPTQSTPKYGDLVDISSKEDDLLNAGATQADIDNIKRLHYSGWSIQQIVSDYGLPYEYAEIISQ